MSAAEKYNKSQKQEAKVSPLVGNRIPPNSTEAEIAVLGALMLSNKAISKVTEYLDKDSFYSSKNKFIFEAIMSLSEKSTEVDILTVTEELKRKGNLEKAGGTAYIARINKDVATASNVEQYALMVLEKQLRRQLIDISGNIINNSYDESVDVLEEIDRAEAEIFRIAEKRISKSYKKMNELTHETYSLIEKLRMNNKSDISGIPTGLSKLDEYLGGFQKSDLIIIAARPSMGKTALALSLARNMTIEFDKSVAFFSLEMASTQLVMRLISAESKIDQQKIRKGAISNRDNEKIVQGLGKLASAKLYIDDSALIDIMELRAKCRRLKAEHDIDAIFVDYLQLIQAGGAESREREISYISQTLKQIAKELNIPVIALAQLNRSIENRTKKERTPMLSDLRESGSIEQDADVIIFVQRREVWGEAEYEDKNPTEGTGELIIGKQRNGPIGTIRVAFQKDYARFENLSYGFEEPPSAGPIPNDIPPQDDKEF